eukprot:5989234-Amphidinium_carterae.1
MSAGLNAVCHFGLRDAVKQEAATLTRSQYQFGSRAESSTIFLFETILFSFAKDVFNTQFNFKLVRSVAHSCKGGEGPGTNSVLKMQRKRDSLDKLPFICF